VSPFERERERVPHLNGSLVIYSVEGQGKPLAAVIETINCMGEEGWGVGRAQFTLLPFPVLSVVFYSCTLVGSGLY
jgi:hypothetical protein